MNYEQRGVAVILRQTPDFFQTMTTLMDDVQTKWAKEANMIEENMLRYALKTELGREATIEDYKDCQMITGPQTPNFCYQLAYKGKVLGYMHKSELKLTWGDNQDFTENKLTLYQEIKFIPCSE